MPKSAEPTQKVCPKPAPYHRKTKQDRLEPDAPKTSALPSQKHHRENLTLHNWLTVFAWMDSHPQATQADVVKHFATLSSGALLFMQCMLSQKIKTQSELEAQVSSNPSALSTKRPRVVTRPDVEQALILWARHMEAKSEIVTGPMLKVKRERFEEKLGVPEGERLLGDGWIAQFCRTYKLKEVRRHGEAASVNLQAVEVERV
jgi:hypothetical protein